MDKYMERMEFIGIRKEVIKHLTYNRAQFVSPASGAGLIVSDIYGVTNYQFDSQLFSGQNIDALTAREILCMYTEAGRGVRHMYEKGLSMLLEYKKELNNTDRKRDRN